jgi:hypothetical protein
MERMNRTGLFITLLAVVLLVAQFVITFSQPLGAVWASKEGIASLAVHFTPYVLLLVGLYILFGKKKMPGVENKWSKIFLTVIASWGLAGAAFLVIVVLALVVRGNEGVEMVFSYLAAITIILTISLFPFVYRRLK